MRPYMTPDGVAARLKDERAVPRARRLRREATKSERALWEMLRTLDAKFRRQVPFGPYIVDFACHSARLIVEVDGAVHDDEDVAARDIERQRWLEGCGYRVLRFTNAEVLSYLPLVMQRIATEIGADTPTPDPAPQGGGERS